MEESKEFYNKRLPELLRDYVFGIERMEAAISNLSEFIPKDSKRIADVGCGLGWSSFEFSRFFPNSQVEGFDLSPILINNAVKLFNSSNLEFFNMDITKNDFDRNYDCIIMIDVYEHIPLNKRSSFHSSINKCLKSDGRLILACPTKFYQNWLRNNKPSGLQPVDENVDANDFIKIADEIEGELIFVEYQSVWNNNDYLYGVIEKNTDFKSPNALRNGRKFELENKEHRSLRVKQNLDIMINLGFKKKQSKTLLKKIKSILNSNLKRT